MEWSIREADRTSRLAAAAAAAIVAISLVSTPHPADSTTPRQVHLPAIQLQAAVTSAAAHTTIAAPATNRAAAATPSADLAPETVLLAPLYIGAVVALAPVWYVAFPVTLPLSFMLAGILGLFLGDTQDVRGPQIVLLAIGIYALGPPALVLGGLSDLLGISYSAAAVSDSKPTDAPAKAPQGSRENRAKRGVAGSRRTATASTNANRTGKKTPDASVKKHSGVAGSGRSVTNKP